jgi:hypothetical protein
VRQAGRAASPQLTPVAVGNATAPTAPAVSGGPRPRHLVAVPDLPPRDVPPQDAPGGGRLPLVTLDRLPGRLGPGGDTELLVMAANPGTGILPESWLGLVLPPGARVSSVTPPAGTVAVTERVGPYEVVRARLGELAPGACVGLDVSITVPGRCGPHRVSAFVTPRTEPEFTLTCDHVLQVDRTA